MTASYIKCIGSLAPQSAVIEGSSVRRHRSVEYLYWSGRRTGRFIEDNKIARPGRQSTWTITSPSLRWLPSLSYAAASTGNLRGQIAQAIEQSLGKIAVKKFDHPGLIRYAKGRSTMVFGEFRTWGLDVKPERLPALMFTSMDFSRQDRDSVAICLFGSMDNFPEYVVDAGPGYRDGWVSSSAPAVFEFIRSHGRRFDAPYYKPAEMALEALTIADGQGLSSVFTEEDTALGTDRAWQRAFTYGEVSNAEWLAQIYLDVDLLATGDGREDGYRRILVGAPLWVRTSASSGLELYAASERSELAAGRKLRAEADIARAPEAPPRARTERHETPPVVIAPAPHESSNGGNQATAEPSGGSTITLPYGVYNALKAGFTRGEAAWIIDGGLEADATTDRIIHLGNRFGRVFAWIWDYDKYSAIILLSDFLGHIRDGHVQAEQVDPPIRLDEVLRGLRPALPHGFPDYDEVVTRARRELRSYYDADPNR